MTQECNVLEIDGLHSVGDFVDERWVKHRWGNVTFSRSPLQRLELATEYRGSLNTSLVSSPLGPLVVVNLYGLFERVTEGSTKKLATPGLHRKLSDLSPLLWKRVGLPADNFLLAGDLNHDRRMDTHKNFRKPNAQPFSGLFSRFEDFGLTDLLHRDYPDGIQTYKSVRGSFPWQLDHAFMSNKVANRARAYVESGRQLESLSDHYPVVIDIEA
jgi:endonuclease/exonuclease/phosphatase family metal-dependent hydrolase